MASIGVCSTMKAVHTIKRYCSLFILLSVFVVAACSSSSEPETALPTARTAAEGEVTRLAESYKLGSGDQIRVNVFRHEDLSGEFELDGNGRFGMPLVGEIDGNGLSVRELEARIAERLEQGYLVDPQISVEVLNYRPFYILGEVQNPGSYPFVNGMTVLNAVALAGGFTYRASDSRISLQRGGGNREAIKVTPDTLVLPGDVIEVPERFF